MTLDQTDLTDRKSIRFRWLIWSLWIWPGSDCFSVVPQCDSFRQGGLRQFFYRSKYKTVPILNLKKPLKFLGSKSMFLMSLSSMLLIKTLTFLLWATIVQFLIASVKTSYILLEIDSMRVPQRFLKELKKSFLGLAAYIWAYNVSPSKWTECTEASWTGHVIRTHW